MTSTESNEFDRKVALLRETLAIMKDEQECRARGELDSWDMEQACKREIVECMLMVALGAGLVYLLALLWVR